MKPVTVEARLAALEFIKDAVRSRSLIPFHEDSLYEPFPARLGETLGEPDADRERLRAILAAAIKEIEAGRPGFVVRIRDTFYGIDLSVAGETEWADVLKFVHGSDDNEAIRKLSPPAAELLERIETGELTAQFRSELSVRHRIRFFGYSSHFPAILEEIKVKLGISIGMEETGERYAQKKHLLRFSIISRIDPSSPPRGYNPVLADVGGKLPNRRAFKRWFSAMLIDAPFTGNEIGLVWSISSRREFFSCFPKSAFADRIDSNPLISLLSNIRGSSAFSVGWNFGNGACAWTVEVKPATSWEETRRVLKTELERATTESQYNLSLSAAELFDWVNSLQPGSLEIGLTPIVEKEGREGRLHLECPWSAENFRLYLEMLCEEISERTALDLRVVDWHQSGSKWSRIRVKKRPVSA